MKLNTTLLMTSLFAATNLVYSQEDADTREDYDLYGPVKSVNATFATVSKKPQDKLEMEYGTDFNDEGFVSGWTFYLNFLGLNSRATYTRDSDNHIIEERHADGENTYLKASYKYDDQNRLSEKQTYYSDGSVEETNTYSYNTQNLVTEIQVTFGEEGGSMKFKFTYNVEGLPDTYVEDWEYSQDIRSYKYNAQGNVTEEYFHSTATGDGVTEDYSVHTSYNDQGKVIEVITKDKVGNITARETTTFDAAGQMTHTHSYNAKGKLTSYTLYSDFDQHGNWLEAISYTKKKITSVESRKIVFY